jgi:transposase
LPEGHIYPRTERAVRDLLRKRSQLVRQATMNLLSIQNLYARNKGERISANHVKQLTPEEVDSAFEDANVALAVKSALKVLQCLQEQILALEDAVHGQVKLQKGYRKLLTVPGIGKILAMTIMLETGDIGRFPDVGNYASYCRCVGSQKISNGKKKGKGNTKNGNKYLSWAFVEAANFAIRFSARIKGYYQKKKAKSHGVVALKAVAHKLCRACYYIIKDRVAFDVTKAFA